MAKESLMIPIVETTPPADSFGYPDAALVFVLKTENKSIHIIFGSSADTMTSAGLDALYANAPNGSIYVCMDSNTTKKIAIKFGNVGLKDGSFLFSSAAYATV